MVINFTKCIRKSFTAISSEVYTCKKSLETNVLFSQFVAVYFLVEQKMSLTQLKLVTSTHLLKYHRDDLFLSVIRYILISLFGFYVSSKSD